MIEQKIPFFPLFQCVTIKPYITILCMSSQTAASESNPTQVYRANAVAMQPQGNSPLSRGGFSDSHSTTNPIGNVTSGLEN